MIIYDRVLERLKEAGYNSGRIMREKLLSQATMVALRHNQPVNTTTIDTICRLIKCQPGDIMRYIEDPAEE